MGAGQLVVMMSITSSNRIVRASHKSADISVPPQAASLPEPEIQKFCKRKTARHPKSFEHIKSNTPDFRGTSLLCRLDFGDIFWHFVTLWSLDSWTVFNPRKRE